MAVAGSDDEARPGSFLQCLRCSIVEPGEIHQTQTVSHSQTPACFRY